MKTLLEYLDRNKHKRIKQAYKYFPSTRDELVSIIEDRIKKEGNNCDLNDIDVSKITDMSYVFYDSDFNGNISNWDVSNVKDMNHMFDHSKFNGDISKWDVSNVENMEKMFFQSNFSSKNGDISKWNVYKCKSFRYMFTECSLFDINLDDWNPSDLYNFRKFYNMFKLTKLESNPPIWYKY